MMMIEKSFFYFLTSISVTFMAPSWSVASSSDTGSGASCNSKSNTPAIVLDDTLWTRQTKFKSLVHTHTATNRQQLLFWLLLTAYLEGKWRNVKIQSASCGKYLPLIGFAAAVDCNYNWSKECILTLWLV